MYYFRLSDGSVISGRHISEIMDICTPNRRRYCIICTPNRFFVLLFYYYIRNKDRNVGCSSNSTTGSIMESLMSVFSDE